MKFHFHSNLTLINVKSTSNVMVLRILQNYYCYIILIIIIVQVKPSPILKGDILEQDDNRKYAFMVSLQERLAKGFQHFCGGTLLSDKWILTAAHCVWEKDLQNVYAVIGFINLRNILPADYTKIDGVQFFNYQWATLRNDIALLHIKAISHHRLKYANSIKIPTYLCKTCTMTACKIFGYGARNHTGQIQHQLQEGKVFLINNYYCTILLGRIWAPESGDNKICALSNYYDTCQGDSGGPLICECNDMNYIYGIISHGLNCDLNCLPSVYTLTAPYWKWIFGIIHFNAFDYYINS